MSNKEIGAPAYGWIIDARSKGVPSGKAYVLTRSDDPSRRRLAEAEAERGERLGTKISLRYLGQW